MISAADLKRVSKGRKASFYKWEKWRQKEELTWPRFTGRTGKRTAVFWILVKHLKLNHLQANTASGTLIDKQVILIWGLVFSVSETSLLSPLTRHSLQPHFKPSYVGLKSFCLLCYHNTMGCVNVWLLPKALERFILLLSRRSFSSPAVWSIHQLLLPTQNYCYGYHNSGI